MAGEARYQVFLSSTFLDLQEERRFLMQNLLKTEKFFPAGMEFFGSADEPPWDYVKKVLDASDYFVLILGYRFGSVDSRSGLSFTQREYRYAQANNIPILAYFSDEERLVKLNQVETQTSGLDGFHHFQHEVRSGNHLYDTWTSPEELASKVVIALYKAVDSSPRPGWVRGAPVHPVEAEFPNRRPQRPQELEPDPVIALILAREHELKRHRPRYTAGFCLIAEPLSSQRGVGTPFADSQSSFASLIARSQPVGKTAEALAPYAKFLGLRDFIKATRDGSHPRGGCLTSNEYYFDRNANDRSGEKDYAEIVVTDDLGIRMYAEPLGFRLGWMNNPAGLDLDVAVVSATRMIWLLRELGRQVGYEGDWALGAYTINASGLPALTEERESTSKILSEDYEQAIVLKVDDSQSSVGDSVMSLLGAMLRQLGQRQAYRNLVAELG